MDISVITSTEDLPRFPKLTDRNRTVFHWSMAMLDGHASLPLLWESAKSSSWYCSALLARGQPHDVHRALQYIENILTQQYTEEGDVTYGTYKNDYRTLWANGDSLAKPKIYDTYDPNNALFVTIAFIIIDANFADIVPPSLLKRMREAMYIAVKGDEERVGGVNGDNLRPCYTNPWFMRMVCAAYVGKMMGDKAMEARSESYLNEALELFDQHCTISEYNSPTYAGVTLKALAISQYLLPTSRVRIKGAIIIQEIWREIGMTYNASLTNLSGAWDRTYGYDMTLYVSGSGAAITNIIGMEGKFPLPNPLAPSLHLDDAAGIPLMCLVAPYLESYLPPATRRAFSELQPHFHSAQAFSPPFDVNARRYSYYVGDGYSVGGIEFDECVPGGPSINLECFAPGVIMWDTGRMGNGVGWISYVPTSASCSIIASSSALRIRYPPSKYFPEVPPSNIIRLHISTFSDLQLTPKTFSTSDVPVVALPGMNLHLTGNVVDTVQPKLSYTGASLHGWRYYVLEYELPASIMESSNIPELVIGLEKVAVEQKPALEGTKMPVHPPLVPAAHIVNSPSIQHLKDLPNIDITTEKVDNLIVLMRDRLINLRDETGKYLYTLENGDTVDTKGWLGWDWTQGVALTALFLHSQVAPPTSATRSLEIVTDWFKSQFKITKGKGAPKNINTMSAIYCLGSMLQNGLLKDDDGKNWIVWVDQWTKWVFYDQHGLPRTSEGGFQHVTYEAANHNQLWDDTLFMTCLPLARASILFNHPAYMQLAIAQFLLHAQYLCDTRTGLWFHGWQFEKIQGRNGHNFAEARWARGNCWITLALPMLLELMDEAAVREDGARTYLITVWRRQVNALLRLQNADNGMWHTILDDSTSYVETSATAGFVAGIFMGIRLGLVDATSKTAYVSSALKGLRAIIAQVSLTGEVFNVSFGTPMGHTLEFYKSIPLTAMPYGQALVILALVEWQMWKASSA